MHNDELLDLVAEQIVSDINEGDVSSIFDMLDTFSREYLIDYLSKSRVERALKKGIITEQEAEEYENV
jgi:hypothetical protein